jgi:hypothetical protein
MTSPWRVDGPLGLPPIRAMQLDFNLVGGPSRSISNDFAESEADKNLTVETYERSQAPSQPKHRLQASDMLLSKIACSLLDNMHTFGLEALKRGSHNRHKALNELIQTLNADPEIKVLTTKCPLKKSTLKSWIDHEGPKLAQEAYRVAEKAGRIGSGVATKAQADWKEVMDRFDDLMKPKASAAKPASKLASSKQAEQIFQQASKLSGQVQREEGVCRVQKRRELCEGNAGILDEASSGEGASDSSSGFNRDDSWKRAKNNQDSSLSKLVTTLSSVFQSYEATSALRAQAEADQARAKLIKAESNAGLMVLAKIEKLQGLLQAALERGDSQSAAAYQNKITELNDQI